MARVIIERNRACYWGYFVKVDGQAEALTFTLWGAKRVAKRFSEPAKRWEV